MGLGFRLQQFRKCPLPNPSNGWPPHTPMKANGRFVLPHQQQMNTLLTLLAQIRSAGSRRLHSANDELLSKAERYQNDYAHNCANAIADLFAHMSTALEKPLVALARDVHIEASNMDLQANIGKITAKLDVIQKMFQADFALALLPGKIDEPKDVLKGRDGLLACLTGVSNAFTSGRMDHNHQCPLDLGKLSEMCSEEALNGMKVSGKIKKALLNYRSAAINAAKQCLVSSLASFSKFTVALAVTDGAPDDVFSAELTGATGTSSSSMDWAYLYMASSSFMKNLSPFLQDDERMCEVGEGKQVRLEVCCTSSVFLRLCMLASQMQGYGVEALKEMTSASASSLLQEVFGAVVPALHDVRKVMESFPPEAGPHHLNMVEERGKQIIATFLKQSLARLADQVDTSLVGIQQKSSVAKMDTCNRLLGSAGGDKDKVAKGQIGTDLLAVANSEEAGELFDAFAGLGGAMETMNLCAMALRSIIDAETTITESAEYEKLVAQVESRVQAAKLANESCLLKAGRILGNLTVIQSLLRELSPGETRGGILKRCARGLRKSALLSCDSLLGALLPQEQAKEQAAAPAAERA